MNLFEKYGIKEVADVVFYSINEIGEDEVVYTPVLFLDTLKVSTLDKTAESAFAQGGLGNKRLIKWDYGKEISLTLEDALFSPASMSMIWGDKLNADLSVVTSIISKINVANLYGRLRYSTKAYPSPSFTNEEWEIVFKILQNSNIDTITSDNSLDVLDRTVASTLSDEWRQAFINRYYDRPALFNGIKEVESDDGSNDPNKSWTYLYDRDNFGNNFGADYLKISQLNIEGYESINDNYDDEGNLKPSRYRWYEAKAMPEYVIFILRNLINSFNDISTINNQQGNVEVVDRFERCIVTSKNGFEFSEKTQLDNLFRYYADDRSDSYSIYYDSKTMLPLVRPDNDDNISWQKKHLHSATIDKFNTIKKEIDDPTQDSTYQAYSNSGIDESFINNLSKSYPYLSLTLRDLYSRVISTSDNESDTILVEILSDEIPEIVQLETLGFLTEESPSQIYSKNCVKICRIRMINDLSKNTVALYISGNNYYRKKYSDYFSNYVEVNNYISSVISFAQKEIDTVRLKFGTTYYKWTRTVKYQEYEEDSVLGQSFVIDSDTFPDDYRIVGETYIRNQKTGKDERYQFTIFRANISSDTSLTLQADGDPTTFSMNIDVLSPENDVLMQLTQMDVEEDRFEGGTRIVPMKSTMSYTHSMDAPEEVLVPINNNEIY